MDLDALLAEVEGLGADRFTPSTTAVAVTDTPAAVLPGQEATRGESPATNPPEIAFALVRDVEMELAVELGTARLPLREIMHLRGGAQFELEQRPDELLTITVNGHPIAQGEAVIVDGMLAVKVVRLLTGKTQQ